MKGVDVWFQSFCHSGLAIVPWARKHDAIAMAIARANLKGLRRSMRELRND
jgi:hypothetical protein